MRANVFHFPHQELARYALATDRGRGRFQPVREHLATGCAECTRAVSEASRTAFGNTRFELPRGWIRPVRMARVGGLRAGSIADHQMSCCVGEYDVEILVRELETDPRLRIGGQLTRTDTPDEPLDDVPLQLVRADNKSVIGATRTDPFGEFLIPAGADDGLGLRLGPLADSPCILIWDGRTTP